MAEQGKGATKRRPATATKSKATTTSADPIEEFHEAVAAIQPALGRVATEFARLEDTTTLTINALLRIDHKEGLILEILMPNFNSRIRLLEALIRLHLAGAADAQLKQDGVKVCKLIGEANSDRNNLLHESWDIYSPETKGLSKATRLELQGGELRAIPVFQVTKEVVEATAKFIQRTTLALSHWRARLVYRDVPHIGPAPLPDKFYEGSPLHRHIGDQKRKAATGQPQS